MAFGRQKEDVFFTKFKDFSAQLVKMGEDFGGIVNNYASAVNPGELMKETESLCDAKKHAIVHELNNSFVTPFDREDIFVIAGQLDDIADFMEEIVSKFVIYGIRELREEAVEMGNIITRMTKLVDALMCAMPESKKNDEARQLVIKISSLEDLGDAAYRRGLSRLFREEKDPVEIIRWKDLFEIIEDGIDAGEHLAETVEGVLTKNA